jgi:hypothetical protein
MPWTGPWPRTSARGRPHRRAGARGRGTAHFALRARRPGCWPGGTAPPRPSASVDPEMTWTGTATDGRRVAAGDTVVEVTGPLRPILTAERTALNFLGHLSGIATLTAQFVTAAHARNPSVPRSSTPARPRPGLRPSRRRPCGPAAAPTTGPACPRPCWSRTTTWPGLTITDAVPGPASCGRAGWSRSSATALDQVAEAAGPGPTRRAARQHGPRARWSRPSRGARRTRPGPPDRGVGRGDPGQRSAPTRPPGPTGSRSAP